MERKAPNQNFPFEFISKMITFVSPSSFKSGHTGNTSTSRRFRPLSVKLQTSPPMVNAFGNANVTVKSWCPAGRFGLRRTGIVGSIVILLPSWKGGLSQERSRKVAGLIYGAKHSIGEAIIRILFYQFLNYLTFWQLILVTRFFFSFHFGLYRFSQFWSLLLQIDHHQSKICMTPSVFIV